MNETPHKGLLSISLSKLHRDCQGHPKLTFEWGTALAEARKRTKLVKNRLVVLTAQLGRKVRQKPFGYLGGDATVQAVADFITVQPEFQELKLELIEAEYEEEQLENFMRSCADRKKGMEGMIKLFGQMYWSKPDTSIDNRRSETLPESEE